MLFWLAAIETPAGKGALTAITTVLEVAGLPEAHNRLEVMETYTWSPFDGTYEYVDWFAPTGRLFLYHWYTGVPPFTGVAVKVTGVPWHTLF